MFRCRFFATFYAIDDFKPKVGKWEKMEQSVSKTKRKTEKEIKNNIKPPELLCDSERFLS